jgi:predicted membrane protein
MNSVPRPAAALLYGRAGRAVSLALALAVTAVVTACPHLFARSVHEVPHGLLAVLMLGMSAAYVHGVGYVPQRQWLQPLVGPLAAWPLIGVAAVQLVSR